MQSEFNNRISAQRAILRVVNEAAWTSEPLAGLSSKAIARWMSLNSISTHSVLATLLTEVSAKLFFLANKSQEQISDEYQMVRSEIIAARDDISEEIVRLGMSRVGSSEPEQSIKGAPN